MNYWLIIPVFGIMVAITPAVQLPGGEYVIDSNANWLSYSNWINGRTVLAGHTPGVFQDLVNLEENDVILIKSFDGAEIYQYRVMWFEIAVPGDETFTWHEWDGDDLVFITCHDNETKRLLVGAKLEYRHEPF